MKRYLLILAALALLLAVTVSAALAQAAATDEPAAAATDEPTAAATLEAVESVTDIFARLPQTRTADGGFVVGAASAPITIVEFADYACPHCQVYSSTMEQVIQQYVATGQAKFELRLLPTAGGQLSYYVGQLLECANHQRVGAFWQSYEPLFSLAETGQYDSNIAQRIVDAYSLNTDKLATCMTAAGQVDRDTSFAFASGVMGTPAVLVRFNDGEAQFVTLEGRQYSQGGVPFEVLAQVIDAANAPAAA
jgi:protein-disulfide isomerase